MALVRIALAGRTGRRRRAMPWHLIRRSRRRGVEMVRGSAGRTAVLSLIVAVVMTVGVGCGSSGSSSTSESSAAASNPKCSNGDKSLKGKTVGLSFAHSQALFSQLQDDIKQFAKLSGCGLKF